MKSSIFKSMDNVKIKIKYQLVALRKKLEKIAKEDEELFKKLCVELYSLKELDRHDINYIKYHDEGVAKLLNYFYNLIKLSTMEESEYKNVCVISKDALIKLIQETVEVCLWYTDLNIEDLLQVITPYQETLYKNFVVVPREWDSETIRVLVE